jgi:hypothetical protein
MLKNLLQLRYKILCVFKIFTLLKGENQFDRVAR